VARASLLAESADSDPAATDAYVNLARLAVERSALEVIALAERGLGLSAFTRPSPVERVVRDLSTYLRQPFPDGALEGAAAYLLERDGPPAWDGSAA
jgi:alkylation response protein AidB-like acyl-CoA dehydrogenase